MSKDLAKIIQLSWFLNFGIFINLHGEVVNDRKVLSLGDHDYHVQGPYHQLSPHVTGSGFCDSFPGAGLTPICMNSNSESDYMQFRLH